MSAYNMNLAKLDQINAGKHSYYNRQHINNARLTLCAQNSSNIALCFCSQSHVSK